LRAAYAKLQSENKSLREALVKEKSSKDIIEIKLKKNAIHKELKENAESITDNRFFE